MNYNEIKALIETDANGDMRIVCPAGDTTIEVTVEYDAEEHAWIVRDPYETWVVRSKDKAVEMMIDFAASWLDS